jgi:hypothetical protein
MIAYTLIIIFVLLTFLPIKAEKWKFLSYLNKHNDSKTSSTLLIVWIILGFFTRQDFSQLQGDIIYFEKIFNTSNIIFSIISLSIVITSKFLKQKPFSKLFLILELTYWLFKLGYYKGGYNIGFAADYPLDTIVFYDFIALLLRLLNINNLFANSKLHTKHIGLIAIILISIKIFFIPRPHNIFWETYLNDKKIENTCEILEGKWTGIVTYDSLSSDTIKTIMIDTAISFFSQEKSRKHFDTIVETAYKERKNNLRKKVLMEFSKNDKLIINNVSEYKLNMISYNWGEISSINDKKDSLILNGGELSIRMIKNDTLIMSIWVWKDFCKEIKLYLKKTPDNSGISPCRKYRKFGVCLTK